MTSASTTATSAAPRSDTLAGLAFVFIWSTGYIAAPAALHGMGPYTLACLRFFGSALLIALGLLIRGAPRPATRTVIHAAIAGALLQAGFFGFIYAGMHRGVPAAAAGLITGLMPLTTALGAALLLREPLHRSAMLGLAVGLAGVLLVIAPALAQPGSALGYGLLTLALLSLSGGTLYQKRFVSGIDPLVSLLAQLLAAMLVLAPAAFLVDGFELHWSPIAIAGLSWAIVVNSCIGLLLYLALLSRGASGKVASLFYLVPPTTAVLAALILGAHFGARDAVGFALAAAGVWLGQRGS
jgi:drug/metabolite transporter (DMT)-like permease